MFSLPWAWVQSLVGELRSHKPHSMTELKKKKKRTSAPRDSWDQKVPLVYISPSLVVSLPKGTGAKEVLWEEK